MPDCLPMVFSFKLFIIVFKNQSYHRDRRFTVRLGALFYAAYKISEHAETPDFAALIAALNRALQPKLDPLPPYANSLSARKSEGEPSLPNCIYWVQVVKVSPLQPACQTDFAAPVPEKDKQKPSRVCARDGFG